MATKVLHLIKQQNLASLNSIEKFVATLLNEVRQLDILNQVLSNSMELELKMIIGVNHLGHSELVLTSEGLTSQEYIMQKGFGSEYFAHQQCNS